MLPSALNHTPQTGLFLLAAGLALAVGGVALITSGARARREVLSRRVSLLGRRIPALHPEPAVRKAPAPVASLVRPASGPLPLAEQRR